MQKTKFKTMMCRHLQQKGFCSLQDRCYFAHSLDELRSESDPLPENLPGQIKPLSNYKTQLCKFYVKGYCKNRDECTYAHGQEDIRSMPVVPAQLYSKETVMLGLPPRIQPTVVNPPQQAYYPMYMVPVMPVVNPNIHLLTIIQNLYQVFPGQQQLAKQLRRAEQLAFKGEYAQASEALRQIVMDPDRTEPEKEKLRIIIQNASYLNSLKTGGYGYPSPPNYLGKQ